MTTEAPGPTLAERITAGSRELTADGIATSIGALVRHGDLGHGDRLPTVRQLARSAGVSSSTVAEAWRILGRHGLIETARRNGTTVRAARTEMTGRFWRVPATLPANGSPSILDLSTGTPDTDLLPTIASMLSGLDADISITSYIDRPVLEELEVVLRSRSPFDAEAVTVLDGSLDALDRCISALVHFGDAVIVEDPTFPPILDMLERVGAEVIGVAVDEQGIVLDRLADALAAQPVLAILQPAAHNPTGRSMQPERLDAVASLFDELAPNTWIVEDHHTGDLVSGPVPSIGVHLPHRVVHIHSFSKSHGPDLRVAAVSGAAEPIAAVVDRRRLGPSWTSRLIQHILLTLLQDPATDATVARAAAVYDDRRLALCKGLGDRGIDVCSSAGLNLWVPVANEQRAVLALALVGIGVAPGAPFSVDNSAPPNHIRVSLGNARSDLDHVVDAIATAATA
jgi:DNA-binding transcriptional MocR family regulator